MHNNPWQQTQLNLSTLTCLSGTFPSQPHHVLDFSQKWQWQYILMFGKCDVFCLPSGKPNSHIVQVNLTLGKTTHEQGISSFPGPITELFCCLLDPILDMTSPSSPSLSHEFSIANGSLGFSSTPSSHCAQDVPRMATSAAQ